MHARAPTDLVTTSLSSVDSILISAWMSSISSSAFSRSMVLMATGREVRLSYLSQMSLVAITHRSSEENVPFEYLAEASFA